MIIDQVALAPAYCAGGTAVLAFLTDLVAPARRVPVPLVTVLGTAGTAAAALLVGHSGNRSTFCVAPGDCSLVSGPRAGTIAALFALLTLAVVVLSTPTRRPGEYYFLLAASMTGGVVLASAGDLITLIVAVETVTLPLYPLVAWRDPDPDEAAGPGSSAKASAEAGVTFFVVSVVSTAVTLLGAALLYAATGALYFTQVAAALGGPGRPPLTTVGMVLLVAGLSFKVAAVPFHAWAPAAYDGAPLPVAAYLSTASKLAGVVAIVYLAVDPLRPAFDVIGPVFAIVAVLTMTVGNLVALRQARMVRLLAWSSVAQAGYILVPLGSRDPGGGAVAASLGYAVFYVLVELAAFGAVIALRPGTDDGGTLASYAGSARRSPYATAALVLALVGLAGLPPGLAGLFAKVVVIRSVIDGGSSWLAVAVALNAVIGLAYYLRAATVPLAAVGESKGRRTTWSVAVVLALVTVTTVVAGLAPQVVLDAVRR
jgi:NADH-quinone oxidoreductase subunit N